MKNVIFAALLLGANIAPAHAETSQTAQMIKSIDAFVTAHAGELVVRATGVGVRTEKVVESD